MFAILPDTVALIEVADGAIEVKATLLERVVGTVARSTAIKAAIIFVKPSMVSTLITPSSFEVELSLPSFYWRWLYGRILGLDTHLRACSLLD